jgi:hypothetical protein
MDLTIDVSNLLVGTGYVIFGGVLGILILGFAAYIVPRIVDKITPRIDDEKELLRGNVAVGVYTGLITAAVILGISIIIAASIISGLM